VVAAAPPTIVFSVPNHTYGDPPFAVAATSNSTGTIGYSVVSGPATIAGSTVTLTGAGTVVLQASVAANGNFATGTQNATFTVAKEAQAITFPAPGSPVSVGAGPIPLSATATSGLPITYSILSGSATINGAALTPTAVGTIVVAADQPGNANYLAAAEQTHTIVITKGVPSIAISGSPNPVLLQNPVTLTANVSSSAVTPTGSVVFAEGSTVLGTSALGNGVASITTSALSLGSNTITATYNGDANFNPLVAPSVNVAVQDFSLSITGNPNQAITYGGAATYALSVTSIDGTSLPGAIAFSVAGAPPGSTAIANPQPLPAGSGASNITLTVQVPSLQAASGSLGGSTPGAGASSARWTALALASLLLPLRRRLKLRGRSPRRFACGLLLLTSVGAAAALSGCGANIILPLTQTFSLTITGTSGPLSHSVSAALIVQ